MQALGRARDAALRRQGGEGTELPDRDVADAARHYKEIFGLTE
jgi:hypothetical protein